MPREIVCGNGCIAVAFDNSMNVRDFFYPRVGLENHLIDHFLRMGLWVDGSFSWFDDSWNTEMGYMPETLVGRCRSSSLELGIALETNDCVHNSLDVFLRKREVANFNDEQTTIGYIQYIWDNNYKRYGCEKLQDQCSSFVKGYCEKCPLSSGEI